MGQVSQAIHKASQAAVEQSGHFQKIGRKKEHAKLSYFWHKFGQKQILPLRE
jgi:hypothetical protein